MSQEDGGSTPEAQEAEGGQEPEQESKRFDESYVKKLRDEAAQARTARKELEARLKEIEDRDKSEAEKLAERADAAEKRAATLEARQERLAVGEEKGLTPSQAGRLVGNTRAELLEDADKLIADLGLSSGGLDQGARRQARPNDFDSLIRARAGR